MAPRYNMQFSEKCIEIDRILANKCDVGYMRVCVFVCVTLSSVETFVGNVVYDANNNMICEKMRLIADIARIHCQFYISDVGAFV